MYNYELCDTDCFCKRRNIPLSSIECPIRKVEMNSTGSRSEDFNFKEKNLQRIIKNYCVCNKNKKRTHCSSKYRRYNTCDQIFRKTDKACNTIEGGDKFTKKLLYDFLYHPKEKLTKDDTDSESDYKLPNKEWINNLYELYNSVAGAPETPTEESPAKFTCRTNEIFRDNYRPCNQWEQNTSRRKNVDKPRCSKYIYDSKKENSQPCQKCTSDSSPEIKRKSPVRFTGLFTKDSFRKTRLSSFTRMNVDYNPFPWNAIVSETTSSNNNGHGDTSGKSHKTRNK